MEYIGQALNNHLNYYGIRAGKDREIVKPNEEISCEKNLIDQLFYLLNKVKSSSKRCFRLSSNIYTRFIEIDNEVILKTVRRLFIIYSLKIKSERIRRFFMWRKIAASREISSFVPVNIDSKQAKLNSEYVHKGNQYHFQEFTETDKSIQQCDKILKEQKQNTKSVRTFKSHCPSVNFQLLAPIPGSQQVNKLYERIENDRKAKINKNTILAKKKNEQEMRECTFNPQTNISLKEFNIESFILRTKENIECKKAKDKLEALKRDIVISLECPFTPTINKTYIGNSDHQVLVFEERQKYFDKRKKQNIENLTNHYNIVRSRSPLEKDNGKHCRKKPMSPEITAKVNTQLSHTPIKVVKYSKSPDNPLYDRNYHFSKRRKLLEKEKECLKEKGITFKPMINSNYKVIYDIETRNKIFQSIKEEKIKVNELKKYENCTFSPEVNDFTSKINKITNVNRGLKNTVGKADAVIPVFKEKSIEVKQTKLSVSSSNKDRKDLIQKVEEDIEKRREKRKLKIYSVDISSDILTTDEIVEYERSFNERKRLQGKSKNESLKGLNMPLKRSSQSRETSKDSKLKKNFKPKAKKTEINSLSDTQMLEIANQMITTDQSLDDFQRHECQEHEGFDLRNEDDSEERNSKSPIDASKDQSHKPKNLKDYQDKRYYDTSMNNKTESKTQEDIVYYRTEKHINRSVVKSNKSLKEIILNNSNYTNDDPVKDKLIASKHLKEDLVDSRNSQNKSSSTIITNSKFYAKN